MSNEGFTPGPWVFYHNGVGDEKTACIELFSEEKGEGRGHIAYLQSTAHLDDGISPQECEANARLIAAAPELYHALEMMLLFSKPTKTNAAALNNAHRVAAKARGESQ